MLVCVCGVAVVLLLLLSAAAAVGAAVVVVVVDDMYLKEEGSEGKGREGKGDKGDGTGKIEIGNMGLLWLYGNNNSGSNK